MSEDKKINRRLCILRDHLNYNSQNKSQQQTQSTINDDDQLSLQINNCYSISNNPPFTINYFEPHENESLRSYHLSLKQKDNKLLPKTKSLNELKAFYATDANSLSSRLLQSRERKLFTKGYTQTREKVLEILNTNDLYTIDNEWNVHQFRQQLDSQYREFMKSNLITVQLINEEIHKFLGGLEVALNYDVSFAAKVTVSLQLFGTCIYRLGTEKHLYLLDDLNKGIDIGCFMMTEIGHGSNVRKIETTATFDNHTKEFIIHSPTDSSCKYWIGNSAVYGTKAVVFAQLLMNGQNKGVHVFYVPLRDPKTLTLREGIEVRDVGVKQGWNAVDNGCIRFNKVRIPLDNLLDKYGKVDVEGNYSSNIKDENVRFAVTLSALAIGRLLYIAGPTFALQTGLTTAVRYAHQRRQFGNGMKETLIWDYPTHKDKIIPMFAYVHAFYAGWSTLAEECSKITEDFHAIVSGIKAYTCEYVSPALLTLRVCCGGHGYSENNRIGRLMNDMDVFNTAEGDGTVLYQQVAKYLMDKLKNQKLVKKESVLYQVFNESNKKCNTSSITTNNVGEFQRKALSFRVFTLLQECGKLLTKDSNWNNHLVKLVELAKSYIELELLNRLQNVLVINAVDNESKLVLQMLSDMFGYLIIRKDLSFYLINNYFDGTIASQMEKGLEILFRDIDKYTLDIITSFNVPDFLLRAPIGVNGNYVQNTLESIGMKRLNV
ncbi:hypothetical protein ABK040_015392 [Willaertia magna]